MALALTTIPGIIIGQLHGISAERLKRVHESFDGKTEATTTITCGNQTMYSITIQDSYMLITIPIAEVCFTKKS